VLPEKEDVTWKSREPRLVIAPEQWRAVSLRQERGPGDWSEADLLRPLAWLEAQQVVPSGRVWLDLPEMSAVGWFQVLAVGACLPLEPGEGRLTTGVFRHSRGIVWDLEVEGESRALRGTGTHPVWSPDREMWVPLIELRLGERLLAKDGSTPRVLSLALRAEPEPVYNIEVEGDHCYRVGQQGLLVHNASVGPIPPPATVTDGSCCPEITIATSSVFELKNSKKAMNFIHGELDSGELVFDVQNKPKNTPQDGCPGKWMFEQMWGHFGSGNISVLLGFWIGSDSDNLRDFNSHVSAGKTKEQAAWLTWTGMRATEKGFKNVHIDSTDPKTGTGPFVAVQVRFTR
jgi:hypothetical protein